MNTISHKFIPATGESTSVGVGTLAIVGTGCMAAAASFRGEAGQAWGDRRWLGYGEVGGVLMIDLLGVRSSATKPFLVNAN